MELDKEDRKRERKDSEEHSSDYTLSKKVSLPQIANIDLNSQGESSSASYSPLTHPEEETQEVTMAEATIKLEDLHPNVTQYELIIRAIEGFLITSAHYTPRDKREIVAQLPNFKAITSTINATKADGITPLQDVRNSGIASKKQMVLYHMVGKHGWEAALRTLSSQEDHDLGMPKVEPLQRPVIHYIPAQRTVQSRGGRKTRSSYSKPASRAHGGAPRQ